jgi:serine/threonine-protein kinase
MMPEEAPFSSSRRYVRLATLGQGGMARVDLVLSRGVAGADKLLVLKEIRPELRDDPEFLEMFFNEARIAARLNHPNVIHTYEVKAEEDLLCLVMEYLEGQPLHAILDQVGRDRFPLDVHLRILCDVAAGLHYAHELCDFDGAHLAIVHRDVSPRNVFVSYDGQVKLVDFGIAKAARGGVNTRKGAFKGTVSYAAPEQLSGLKVDRRADVFALGVMLWEALAGRRLAGAELGVRAATRRMREGDPSILTVAPGTPAALAAVCDRAMERDREHRFATAAELRAAIEQAMDEVKRVGSVEIGAVVTAAFPEERRRMRALIESRTRESGGPLTPTSIRQPSLVRAVAAGRAPARRPWLPFAAIGAVFLAALTLAFLGQRAVRASPAPAPAASATASP